MAGQGYSRWGRALLARLVAGSKARRAHGEDGFTLLELLIVVVIMPLIIGAVAIAVITGLKATASPSHDPQGTAARLADSHDAQIASAVFVRDVQGALTISTGLTNPYCTASGAQLLTIVPNGTTNTAVSYGVSSSPNELIRRYCVQGSAESDVVVAHDLFNLLPGAPSISTTCTGNAAGANSCALGGSNPYAWITVSCGSTVASCTPGRAAISAAGVKFVELDVIENQSGFHFTLKATPRLWNPTIGNQPPGCDPNLDPSCAPKAPLLLLGSGANIIGCVGGNGTVSVNGLAAVNSTTDGAVSMGNSTLSASGLYTGDTSNPNGAATSGPGGSYPQPPASGNQLTDPYASMTPPPTTAQVGPPPVYVYNTTFNASGVIPSGIYILNSGVKMAGSTGIVSAPGGVLFYVTGGSVDLTGGGSVNLSPYPGYRNVVIWVPASNPNTVKLGGNGNVTTINGVVYAPTSSVSTLGNGSVSAQNLTASSLACNGNGATSIGFGNTFGIVTVPSSTAVVAGPTTTNTDNVTVTGNTTGGAPTGNVTFYLCGPSVTSCSSSGTNLGTVALSPQAGSDVSTATSVATAAGALNTAGTYCFAGYYAPAAGSSYTAANDSSSDECFVAASGTSTPAVTITFPGSGGSYSHGPGNGTGTWNKAASAACSSNVRICGTDSDTGATITSIQISITGSNGSCWDGSLASGHFTATCDHWVNVGSGVVSPWYQSFDESWFGTLRGSFTVKVKVTDSLGNTAQANGTFTIT